MTTDHVRTFGTVVFDGETPEPPFQQVQLIVADPGVNLFLYRTRLWFEARVWAWSPADDETVFFNWYNTLMGFVGLQHIAADVIPETSEDPIGGADGDVWVQWEALNQNVEQQFTSHNGNLFYCNKFSLAGGISESFAKRKPNGFATQTLWLAWNFLQTPDIINVTHESFDPVFDLQVSYAVDSFWQEYPA